MPTSTQEILGPWVRLKGISILQLPPSDSRAEPDTVSSPAKIANDSAGVEPTSDVKTFITNVLLEAIPFIDGVAPKSGTLPTWKSKGSPKTYPASAARVHLSQRTIAGNDLVQTESMSKLTADRKDENWFCRRSCHQNKAQSLTASWEEFVHAFKDHHAESEEAFTPTVIGAREAMRWDTSGIEVTISGERWINISVAVEEMKHKINPKPLKNRTFPVVQVAADLANTQEFIVVSIPLRDFEESPYAEYARDKSLVVATYVSVERIRVLPANGDVEWIMATASNAGGVLPQWMQNLAVPSAIAKDVELFLSWILTQRNKVESSPVSNPTAEDKNLP